MFTNEIQQISLGSIEVVGEFAFVESVTPVSYSLCHEGV